MEVQVSHRICTEIPSGNCIWEDKSRCGGNIKRIKRAKRGGDTGGGMLSGSYPYACGNSAALERSPVYGIAQE